MEVQRSLSSQDGFDLDIDLKLSVSESVPAEAARALHRLIAAIRAAFDVLPYDGDTGAGLTGGECMSLFYDFATYIDDCKKKLGFSQTSSPSAVPQDAPSLTPSVSVSLPTEPESSQPNPSSTQPEPPLFSGASPLANG